MTNERNTLLEAINAKAKELNYSDVRERNQIKALGNIAYKIEHSLDLDVTLAEIAEENAFIAETLGF